MDNTEELKHISLCTGYGGIDLGLKRAIRNIRTICYVEIEYFAIENLVSKIEAGLLDLAPIWSNLKTFDWEIFSQKVDILSGGFPCQPFSTAGRRAADEDSRHLWPSIKRGIKICRPTVVFLENVEGIFSSKLHSDQWSDPESTPVLLHILRELERLGYRATAGIFSASEVGAPHRRKRVFILGISDDLKRTGYDVINRLIESNTQFENVWPAFREEKQYSFEPKRVAMGNSDGFDGNKRTRLFSRSFSKKIGTEKTIRITRANYNTASEKVGNSNNKRLLRNRNEKKVTPSIRWKGSYRYNAEASTRRRKLQRKIKPSVGRITDGITYRLDDAKLYQSVDNRTDELRLLGNGVVPATAERAFKTLLRELAYSDVERLEGLLK